MQFSYETALGTRFVVSALLETITIIIIVGFAVVCLLFFLRILLRNQKAAIAACIAIIALSNGPGNIWGFAILLVSASLWLFVLMRFGLVATTLFSSVLYIFMTFPITLDASAWYSGYGYLAFAIWAVIVLYAFRTSLGGRSLLAPSRLDD